MEEPFFSKKIKVEVKEEEPWDDFPQEIQSDGFVGAVEEEPEEDVYTTEKDSDWSQGYEIHPTAFNGGYEKYEEVEMKPIPRARKRPLPGTNGTANFGVLPIGEGSISQKSRPSWEEASGAQHAEDIMRQIDAEERFAVKKEVLGSDQEDKMRPPCKGPFVGALPFDFKCPTCGTGFHVFLALQYHFENVHGHRQPLRCHLCPAKYMKEGTFRFHLMKKHGVAPPLNNPAGYDCDECDGHFQMRSFYASHCQYFRGRPHSFCQQCQQAVHSHLWTEHQKSRRHSSNSKIVHVKYSCQDCGKWGMDKWAYEEHMENLKTVPHAFCEPCAMILDSEEWEKHQKVKGHKGVKMHFYCCKVIFRPEEWEEHQMTICRGNDMMPFSCHHCPRRFWVDTARRQHEVMDHRSH